MLETFSESKLRQRAEVHGWPVTHKQFSSYREWGLLPEPDNGRWTLEVAGRLIRIRELSDTVRSLPRRVIVLRQDYAQFPVPPEKLRQALLDVIPTMTAPLHKMRQVHRACVSWGTHTATIGTSEYLAQMQTWEPPRPDDWAAVLCAVDLDLFDTRVRMMYYLASILAAYAHGTEDDLADIAYEEQIILLTMRDLAWVQYLDEQAQAMTGSPDA